VSKRVWGKRHSGRGTLEQKGGGPGGGEREIVQKGSFLGRDPCCGESQECKERQGEPKESPPIKWSRRRTQPAFRVRGKIKKERGRSRQGRERLQRGRRKRSTSHVKRLDKVTRSENKRGDENYEKLGAA